MAQSEARARLAPTTPFSPGGDRVVGMPKVSRVAEGYPGAPARHSTGDTDFGGFLEILRRHVRKIILATLIAVSLSCVYLALAKPVYTASASLFIDPRNRKVVSDDPTPDGYGTDLALVESQASIITSESVLRRVVTSMHLTDDPEYAPTYRPGFLSKLKGLVIHRPATPEAATLALNSLADSITVKRAQKTYVVDIEVSASSPAKAARVAQAVMDAYLADQTAAKSANAKRANALIDARLGELRAQVRATETRYDDYKRANRILTTDGSNLLSEQQLAKLNEQLATARAVKAEAKARYDQIRETLKSGADPSALPDAIKSGLVQKLREQYAQVARREAALASQLRTRHPVMIDVRSQLAEVKVQINAELKRVAAAAASDYDVAVNRERDLSAQIEKTKEEVTRVNTAEIKARELEQDVSTSRELMKLFLQRAKETQEQQNISAPDARIITPPSLPTRPSRPIPLLILGLGLVGGLGAGLASALIADLFDKSVRTPQDLAHETGLANVSAIPRLETSRRRSRQRLGLAGDLPKAAQFSDLLMAISDMTGRDDALYRQAILRTLAKIKTQQRPGRPHTVMLASSRRGAGTSATALATAYAAALSGDRVLLVDATSINPDLSKIFATTLKPTNIVVLDSKEHLDQITTHDKRSGLAFLPIALADLRKLKTQQRGRLITGLNALIQNYDLVFIDAGTILDDEAAVSLLPTADQVLFVGRSGATTRSEVAHAMEILEPAGRRLTGTVLTMSQGGAA